MWLLPHSSRGSNFRREFGLSLWPIAANRVRPVELLLQRRICLKSRYNSNFTHSIFHRGLEYPVLFYRWSLLSVERTANCGAIVWLKGPSNVKFFDFSPPQFSCGEPRGLLVILDKPCVLFPLLYSDYTEVRACGAATSLWSAGARLPNHEYYRTNPSIIYSRFMSKTEVVHWRFDCRVYVFVDCSFPLLILSALYLYCYHWSFALPFTVHLIFG